MSGLAVKGVLTARLSNTVHGTPLSEREAQVLRFMAQGSTYVEIGAALHTSENTVKKQASILFQRLGARDRANAVSLAYQLGILAINDRTRAAALEQAGRSVICVRCWDEEKPCECDEEGG